MKSFKIVKYGIFLIALILTVCNVIDFFTLQSVDPMGVVMASFTFTSLTFVDEPENMGGFTSTVYVAIRRDIETYPAVTASPSTNDECVKLLGDFVMKTDKYFIELYGTPDTVGANAESQGELDAKSFKIKGELLYPGTHVDALALCRKLNNAHGVVIKVDPNNGARYCYGTEALPVNFSASLNFGKAAADRRGVTISWECNSFVPAWIYEGEIPLSGSTLPGVS